MGNMIELVSNFAQSLILTWFISEFFGCKFSGFKKYAGYAINTLIIFVETSFINKFVVYDGFFAAIVIATNVIYSAIFLNGKIYAHAFASITSMCFIFSLGSTAIFTMSYFTGNEAISLITEFNVYRLIMHVFCRGAEFAAFKAVIHINREYVLSRKEWVIFIVVSIITWITITFMTKSAIAAPKITEYMFYCILSMIVINILIYYFLIKINDDAKTKLELQLLKIQYDNAQKTQMDMKALFENTYSLKHDLEKHFVAIASMAKEGNNDDIADYAERIIKVNLGSVQKLVFTDNDIFNAILNTKLEICKQADISTVINISGGAMSVLNSEDIVVLFGNLLDNAIEATEHCSEKTIVLNIHEYGECLSICVENNYNKKFSDVNLKTTKLNKGEHGYGVKTIKEIVKKYDGSVKFLENDSGMFCCDILIPK